MDPDDLCTSDDSQLATARTRTATLLPRFSEASHAARTFVFFAASLAVKDEKAPTLSVKLVVRPEAESGAFAGQEVNFNRRTAVS